MRLTVLMPMGGLGSRFAEAGFDTPKPLIEVDGEPMFTRALESFPAAWDVENVFVIRKDQDERYGLGSIIGQVCPGARIAVLGRDTRGAVETCLEARGLVDPELPVVIADCDLRFGSAEYVRLAEGGSLDGLLVGFESDDARYSYAEIGPDDLVIRTAEKDPISDRALLGGYYFRSAGLFFGLAERFVGSSLARLGLKEYYLSHVYNMLLEQGGSVGFAEADSYDIWGTPEELEAYRKGGRG